jgi:hypothetical protein
MKLGSLFSPGMPSDIGSILDPSIADRLLTRTPAPKTEYGLWDQFADAVADNVQVGVYDFTHPLSYVGNQMTRVENLCKLDFKQALYDEEAYRQAALANASQTGGKGEWTLTHEMLDLGSANALDKLTFQQWDACHQYQVQQREALGMANSGFMKASDVFAWGGSGLLWSAIALEGAGAAGITTLGSATSVSQAGAIMYVEGTYVLATGSPFAAGVWKASSDNGSLASTLNVSVNSSSSFTVNSGSQLGGTWVGAPVAQNSAIEISRAYTIGQELTESMNRAAQYRTEFGIRMRGNVSFADYNFGTGNAGTMVAGSGPTQPGTVGLPTNPNYRAFSTGNNARQTDAERKIFENLRVNLGAGNTSQSGTVNVFTERPMCASCTSVSEQFRTEFPNVNVKVTNSPWTWWWNRTTLTPGPLNLTPSSLPLTTNAGG